MAVTVDIPGIGEVKADNAASESTLREILRALGGRSDKLEVQVAEVSRAVQRCFSKSPQRM